MLISDKTIKITKTVVINTKASTAVFKALNLKNLMVTISMQVKIISDTIQFYFENHHPTSTPTPKRNPRISITLTLIFDPILNSRFKYLLRLYNISVKQTMIEKAPYPIENPNKI